MNDHAPNASLVLEQADLFLKSLKPGPLAIAVSGGSDSLGALLAICEANCSQRELFCLTVDHKLRDEAAAEARTVGDICKSLGVTHHVLDWVGEKPKSGIQNAARKARYKLLADACRKIDAIGLVTGHTQDDQLETVAMRASRNTSGSGRGLSGMASATLFFNQMWVLRPFLGFGKTDFQLLLSAQHQTWIDDPSNQDEAFERIRVRKQADFTYSLADIQRAKELRAEMSASAAKYLSQHCTYRDGLFAKLEIKLDNISVLLRAIEGLIDVIGGRHRTLSSKQIRNLEHFVRSDDTKFMTLGRTLIKKKSDTLEFQRENRNLDAMEIAAQSHGIWDGRFRIKNNSHERPIIVAADHDIVGFPPKIFWKRRDSGDQINVVGADCLISVERYVNRYEEVLSILDMPLAIEAAKFCGFKGFKAAPFVEQL